MSCRIKVSAELPGAICKRWKAHLLGDVGQSHNLLERPRYSSLPAGNEDAGGDNGILTLSLEQLLLVHALEELLARVDNRPRKTDDIAHGADIAVCRLKVTTAALILRDSRSGHLEGFGCSRVAVLERNDGRELLGRVEERILRTSYTRRVVALGVGKGAPCGRRREKEGSRFNMR